MPGMYILTVIYDTIRITYRLRIGYVFEFRSLNGDCFHYVVVKLTEWFLLACRSKCLKYALE